MSTHNLPQALLERLAAMPKITVAYSGGLDSRFLCHAAKIAGCAVLAIHAAGPHIPPGESSYALDWARRSGIECLLLEYDPLADPQVARNDKTRCYWCKRALLAKMGEAVRGRDSGPICDGSHLDDASGYRPGRKALAEAGVLSPLAEAGLRKADIRVLAQESGMERADQKARPCLLTRFAYGLQPDAGSLRKLADCEAELETRALALDPPADFRLRLTPHALLQWTGPADWRYIHSVLAKHGFENADIRQCESVSGFFDQSSA